MWIAYNDLAWTEDWLTKPADYEDEVGRYVDMIKSGEYPLRIFVGRKGN